nr:Rpn family recombination-promoting nuclease/putative transposase [uncultured Desulfobacter sp.]
MRNKLHHSHDKLFRETWSDLSNARSFLENYLPAPILELVQLDTLEICKDSFIEKDLKDFYSDLLYKIQIGKAQGFVYFLFEHKSYTDALIHLQLIEYMVKIWRLGLKQSKSRNLSIVIPLVLYHGKDKWSVDKRFASLFDGPVNELAGYIPDFEFILYDLSQYTDDQIRGTIMARVTMLLLKHIFESDVADKLPGIFMLLKELSEQETGLQYFESLIKYVFSNVEEITTEKFHTLVSNALSEEQGGIIMTLAEQLRKEGHAQGLEQGIEQGLLEGIELAVSIKFGDSDDCKTIIAKIKTIQDINRLKALKGKILSAKSVPELMASI